MTYSNIYIYTCRTFISIEQQHVDAEDMVPQSSAPDIT